MKPCTSFLDKLLPIVVQAAYPRDFARPSPGVTSMYFYNRHLGAFAARYVMEAHDLDTQSSTLDLHPCQLLVVMGVSD
jgi:hypothetical protein